MLRITVLNDARGATFKMEGKLTLEWVTEADKAWTAFSKTPQRKPAVVDLRGVSFVDEAGRELLARMHSSGAKLIGTGPMTGALIEEISGDRRRRGNKWIRSVLSLLLLPMLVRALDRGDIPDQCGRRLTAGDSAQESIIPIRQLVLSVSVSGPQPHLNAFRKGLSQ